MSFRGADPLDEAAPLHPANLVLRGLDAIRLRVFNQTGAGQSASFVVASGAYNIASGMPRRVGDIPDALLARSDVTATVEVEPVRLRSTDVERVAGDPAPAAELGWAPAVPWEETLDVVLSDWRGRVQAIE